MNKQFIGVLFHQHQKPGHGIIDKQLAETFVNNLFGFLFPQYSGQPKNKAELVLQYDGLKNTLATLLFDLGHRAAETKEATGAFFERLPQLYEQLLEDAAAVLQNDPAASSLEEVLTAYPGFYAVFVYRAAHQLYRQKVSLLPRVLSEYAHSKTGIDIHPGAKIGRSFFIDHGTGVVIGETAVIGYQVKIYQNVTIGALNVSKGATGKKRHPTIGDNVIIYSGATILGGDTEIGHDSIIGGNVWLTRSIDPFSIVYHKSHISIRDKHPLPEPINFVI